MEQSTKTLSVIASGWLFVNGITALVLLGTQGTFRLSSNRPDFGKVIWPILAVIFVSGVTLLLAVHVYMMLILDDLDE